MSQKIYPCGRCFLRPEVAQKIIAINKSINKSGYKLKLLDCYRPQSAQQKLWDIKPDKRYVAPPEKGSMHSRGVAVDLTITDLEGLKIDLGTPYDFFGPEATPKHRGLKAGILNNRIILSQAMKNVGFIQARSEWWHFSMSGLGYGLSSWEWGCE